MGCLEKIVKVINFFIILWTRNFQSDTPQIGRNCPGDGNCNNQGRCDFSTGTCLCDDGFQGPICNGNKLGAPT